MSARQAWLDCQAPLCGWDHAHCAACGNEVDGSDPAPVDGVLLCSECARKKETNDRGERPL